MKCTSSKVVLVDDDRIQMLPFIAELELRGLNVRQFGEADQCLRSARRSRDIDVFIVDVMLPSARIYSPDDTQNFSYTGIFLARDIRLSHPTTPILILSNHAFRESLLRIEQAMTSIGCCAFVAKQTFGGVTEFADVIQAIVSRGILGAKPRNIFGRLARSILMQPNVAGFGVDLKQLFGPQKLS